MLMQRQHLCLLIHMYKSKIRFRYICRTVDKSLLPYILPFLCLKTFLFFLFSRALTTTFHWRFFLGTCQFLWHSKCLLLDNWKCVYFKFCHFLLDFACRPCYNLWHHKLMYWAATAKKEQKIQLNQISNSHLT